MYCKGRVAVTFADGSQRTFDLLIGCWSVFTPTSAISRSERSGVEHHIGYYVAAFTARGYRPRDELVYVCFGAPGRLIARFAASHDRTMFLFVFAAERLKAGEPNTPTERKRTLGEVFAGIDWEWPRIPAVHDPGGVKAIAHFDRVQPGAPGILVKGPSGPGRQDAAACVRSSLAKGRGWA